MNRRQAVRVAATGSYLPGSPLDNAALEALVGPLPADVLGGLQVLTRHWIIDPYSGKHHSSTTAMAEAAVRQALDRAGLAPQDVDLLVMSTASPEYPLPAAVTFLQARLGLASCPVVEVRGGCAGAVHALDIARRRIADGDAKNAVVVGSEAISPLLAPAFVGRDPDAIAAIRLRDRIALYAFGDAAAAVVLRGEPLGADDDGDGDGAEGRAGTEGDFLGSADACLGGDRAPGMQVIGGGTDAPISEQLARKKPVELKLDVLESARFGPYVFVTGLRELLRRSDLNVADLDACVVPEGNAGYFSSELEAAGLTEAEWDALAPTLTENLADVGATGSAAVPLALDAAWTAGRIKPGHVVALLAVETSRWLYAGLTLRWSAEAVAAGERT